jgi:hypothetical protein
MCAPKSELGGGTLRHCGTGRFPVHSARLRRLRLVCPLAARVGAHLVAVDAETDSAIAETLGGWSCDAANPPKQFNGSFDLERLPAGHSYNLYAERLLGRGAAGRFQRRIYGIMLERCRAQLHGFNGEHEFQCAHPARDAVMLHRAFDQRKKKRLPRGAGAAFCAAGALTVTGSVEFPARPRWC